MTDESFYLQKCIQQVEEKLQWGKHKTWTNKDFNALSEQVSRVSRIYISPDTLKRVFGKIKTYHTYNPQTATRDALAIFLGYQNWIDFKQQSILPRSVPAGIPAKLTTAGSTVPESSLTQPQTSPPGNGHSGKAAGAGSTRGWFAFLGVSFGLLLVAGYLLTSEKKAVPEVPKMAHAGDFVFKGHHTKGYAPFTATFHYDITRLPADSVFIHLGQKDKFYLPKEKKVFTHTYLTPDWHEVKLVAGGKVLSRMHVHVLSRGWEGSTHSDQGLRPIGKEGEGISMRGGVLQASLQQIQEGEVDTNRIFYSNLHNFRDFGVDGDNMQFEVRFRSHASERSIRCYVATLSLIGEKRSIRTVFTNPGCNAWMNQLFGEVNRRGKYYDLSAFAQPIADWHTVRIQSVNRRVTVFFDHKPVYRVSYTQPVGKLKGITCTFTDRGSVDFVRLSDASGQLVYDEEFDK